MPNFDEEDYYICGRCKSIFTSLDQFFFHKTQKSCSKSYAQVVLLTQEVPQGNGSSPLGGFLPGTALVVREGKDGDLVLLPANSTADNVQTNSYTADINPNEFIVLKGEPDNDGQCGIREDTDSHVHNDYDSDSEDASQLVSVKLEPEDTDEDLDRDTDFDKDGRKACADVCSNVRSVPIKRNTRKSRAKSKAERARAYRERQKAKLGNLYYQKERERRNKRYVPRSQLSPDKLRAVRLRNKLYARELRKRKRSKTRH